MPELKVYPRTYPSSTGQRLIWISLSVVVGGMGLAGAVYFGTGHEVRRPTDAAIFVVIGLVFVLLGAYLSLWVLRTKIVLFLDAIEVHELFSKRRLLLSEIAGYRILPTPYFRTLEITSRSGKKLKAGLVAQTDEAFHDWFGGLKNLDEEDLTKSEAELEDNTQLGATPQERFERIEHGRTAAKWLNGITFVAVAWAWFYPTPYEVVITILAALPIVTILMMIYSPGLYDIEERRNEARPSVAVPFILSGCTLTGRALMDVDFVGARSVLVWGLIAGSALALVIVRTDPKPRVRIGSILVIFMFSIMYASGLIAQADTLFDNSQAQVLQATVLSKRISSGKMTRWYLQVSPWGPRSEPNEISVADSVYKAVDPGQMVCIHLRPGTLGIPWYWAAQCRH